MSRRLSVIGTKILPDAFAQIFIKPEHESDWKGESVWWLDYTDEMKKVLMDNDVALLEEIFAKDDWRRHLYGFRTK